AGHDHARHALQRIGHVLVGELAHVFGGDDLDDRIGVALLVEALLDRIAVTGDAYRVEGGGIGGGRRLLRIGRGRGGVLRERWRRQGGHRGHCEGDGGGQRRPARRVWHQLHH